MVNPNGILFSESKTHIDSFLNDIKNLKKGDQMYHELSMIKDLLMYFASTADQLRTATRDLEHRITNFKEITLVVSKEVEAKEKKPKAKHDEVQLFVTLGNVFAELKRVEAELLKLGSLVEKAK